MIRDFTDEAKEELLKAIDAAEAQDQGGWEWFKRNIADGINDLFINDKIADYSNDIKEYYKAIVDKKNTSKARLNEIFDNVYAIEDTYTQKTQEFVDQGDELEAALKKIAEIFNPSPIDGGAYALARPEGEFNSMMADSLSVVLQNSLNQLVTYDKNGNPVYDWDRIGELLQSSPQDVTGTELMALTKVFLEMKDPTDMEQFIALSYQLRWDTDPENGVQYNHRYQPSETFAMVSLTSYGMVTGITEGLSRSGHSPAEWGYTQKQLNAYQIRMGILMDTAMYGNIPVNEFLESNALELSGRSVKMPVHITFGDGGYALELATTASNGYPPAYGDIISLQGYAPPETASRYIGEMLDENTMYQVNQLPDSSVLSYVLKTGESWGMSKTINSALKAGIMGFGFAAGPAGTAASLMYSFGKGAVDTVLGDAEKAVELGGVIDANCKMRAYGKLGYDVQFSVLDNKKIEIHYTSKPSHWDDYILQKAFNDHLSEHGGSRTYTANQITKVMLNGYIPTKGEGSFRTWTAKSMTKKQLNSLGITAEEQQEIVEKMRTFYITDTKPKMEKKLGKILDKNKAKFGGKTNLDSLTKEELKRLLNLAGE